MSQQAKKFTPQQARYFDLINQELNLTETELVKLQQNGFVSTDRLRFRQFKRAYAWIYWKDLPVLVTTDSILHAIHQTYDELLKRVEMTILTQKLIDVLTGARDYLRERSQHAPRALTHIYIHLDTYLTVPLTILSMDASRVWLRPREDTFNDVPEQVEAWIQTILKANYEGLFVSNSTEDEPQVGIETITLFDLPRQIDFTQFRARGHYDKPGELVRYFCAMMWLQLLDFRFVEYDAMGSPTLHREQIAAAILLKDAIEASGQQRNWDDIEAILSAYVGWSDNITLNGLQTFCDDANITSPVDCLRMDTDTLLNMLTENDYGHQRIRGAGQKRHTQHKGELQHNITFALMGARYTIESDIMQQLIFDKLQVDGKPPRPYPSPFDVMYALGNNRALDHLADELQTYGYESELHHLREWVDSHSSEFWENTFYNQWLNAIRALNIKVPSANYPSVMQSDAWEDKTLHTQLGSWTQLRHDNILYAKPPYSPAAVCDYPAGYVEPYPDFYAVLQQYAKFGLDVFTRLELPETDETLEEAQERLGGDYWKHEDEYLPQRAIHMRDTAIGYFENLITIMETLESLSRKELANEAFNDEDILFLRSIIVRKYVGDTQYGGRTEEHWDGWYNDLLPFGDDTCRLITDVHTNYNEDLGDVGVLHIGLNDPALMFFMLDCDDSQSLYVGSAFTLYEHLHRGYPPKRLTDRDWSIYLYYHTADQLSMKKQDLDNYQEEFHKLLQVSVPDETTQKDVKRLQKRIEKLESEIAQFEIVTSPAWVNSFRVSDGQVVRLDLNSAYEDFKAAISPRLRDTLDKLKRVIHSRSYSISSIEDLIEVLHEDSNWLRSFDGMDDDLFNELVDVLKQKGHLK